MRERLLLSYSALLFVVVTVSRRNANSTLTSQTPLQDRMPAPIQTVASHSHDAIHLRGIHGCIREILLCSAGTSTVALLQSAQSQNQLLARRHPLAHPPTMTIVERLSIPSWKMTVHLQLQSLLEQRHQWSLAVSRQTRLTQTPSF